MTPQFAAAIVKAQGQIEEAVKGKKNDHFKAKYADLGAVWDAVREALQGNGLAVLQLPCDAPAGFIGLETILIFAETGETIRERFPMPLKDPTNPQAAGSALTYARRYALSALIGVCPVDDDGNAASGQQTSPKLPTKPLANPEKAVAEAKAQFAKATTIEDMKKVYTAVKNSALDEATKTEVLTPMATKIKEAKAKS